MNLTTFEIKTMVDGEVFEIEALTYSQAITIWKKTTESKSLFRSCKKLKGSTETDRYWHLRDMIATEKISKNQLAELKELCKSIRDTERFKQFKKFNSFKLEPKEN